MRGAWAVGAVALVFGLGLTACGDSGSSGGQSGALPTSGLGATTAPGATASSGAAGDYCGQARRWNRAFERFGQPGTSAEMRAYYTDATAAMDQSRQAAPPEIKPDVDVLAEGLKTLTTGLDSINYEFTRLPTLGADLIVRLMSQQFVDSLTKVSNYNRTRCGIS